MNDPYGHLAGDDVLRETAKRPLSSVRSYDFVGRHGGEEFLVVLNNCNPAYAFARAEEICKSIDYLPVQTPNGAVPITMSLALLPRMGLPAVGRASSEGRSGALRGQGSGTQLQEVAIPKITPVDPDSRAPEPACGADRHARLASRKLSRFTNPKCPWCPVSPVPSFAASPHWIQARASPSRLPAACKFLPCSGKDADS